jgi:hypothetical protein
MVEQAASQDRPSGGVKVENAKADPSTRLSENAAKRERKRKLATTADSAVGQERHRARARRAAVAVELEPHGCGFATTSGLWVTTMCPWLLLSG